MAIKTTAQYQILEYYLMTSTGNVMTT